MQDTKRVLDLKAKRRKQGPWLHAWYDPVANLSTFSSCVQLADVRGDQDYRLLVADSDHLLKVFRDLHKAEEHPLMDIPCAMVVFYSEQSENQMPSLAIAGGSHIYIYRNLIPYYKYTLPSITLDQVELDIWRSLRHGEADPDSAIVILRDAMENGVGLSARSLNLLSLKSSSAQRKFIDSVKAEPVQQLTTTTCLGKLFKNALDEQSVSMIVIGTENRHILVLDPLGSGIEVDVKLPGVPVYIQCVGMFDIEYRIIVACRNGKVYTVKKGKLLGTVIELESQPCGLLVIPRTKQILVGCMDNTIHSFHYKGKRAFSMFVPCSISQMGLLSPPNNPGIQAMLIALDNGEVRLYQNKNLIHTTYCGDAVTAMAFGRYGREDGALVLCHKSGALTIKYLQRNADLTATTIQSGPPEEQSVALKIPKKTKLYVEQTQRERELAENMHNAFQRDLVKLRLTAARVYTKMILGGHGPIANTGDMIKIDGHTQGLGPLFKIILDVRNVGDVPVPNIAIAVTYDAKIHDMDQAVLICPLLVPSVTYTYEFEIRCIDPNGANAPARVWICNNNSCVPSLCAIVNIPPSQLLE